MMGVELLVKELQRHGVRLVATLPGHGLNEFDRACEVAGIRLLDVRNEQSASYIAEVTGRLRREVGVCAVSSGVAHINALTGVANAYFDGAPMLLITGSAPTSTMGKGHFQDMDQVALAAPLCKYAHLLDDPARIAIDVEEAFRAALADRPGPVHLTLPMDVAAAQVDPDQSARPLVEDRPTPPVSDSDMKQMLELCAGTRQPLLIAGSGAYYARAEEPLAAVAKALSAPLVIPIWDRGTVEGPSDEFVGVIGAATGDPRLLADADLVVVVGAAPDYRLGYLKPPAVRADARVVRIDCDAGRLAAGPKPDLAILGDPSEVLSRLAAAIPARGITPAREWLHEARARRQALRERCLKARGRAPEGLHALDILQAVRSVTTPETILVIDGGNIGQWFHQILVDRYPAGWITCGAGAVVGFGIPGAMAAKASYPDRPVILITGDGSVGFTIAELESAARQGLGFVVILADDQAWGITLTEQTKRWGHGITTVLSPVDYAGVARSFGCHGVRVERAQELEPAIRLGLAAERPTLIHVPVVRSSPADQ